MTSLAASNQRSTRSVRLSLGKADHTRYAKARSVDAVAMLVFGC